MSIEESSPARAVHSLALSGSVAILVVHLYMSCYVVCAANGWRTDLTDQVLGNLAKTGLFGRAIRAKLLALVLLVLSLLGKRGRRDERVTMWGCLVWIGIGLAVYLMSGLLLLGDGVLGIGLAVSYVVTCCGGYLVLSTGIARLCRILPLMRWKEDPFGKMESGFPQEERRRATDFSLHLPASYEWKGKVRASWVNIVNPRRGVLILGSPGCGKSRFIIEPIIRQIMGKGMALFVYDFKFDALSRLVHGLFCENRDRYPARTGFYCVNCTDLSRSHRCNVVDPSTLEWVSDAIGVGRTMLMSLNKSWVNRQGDFFVESPINFVAALVWFLRNYEGGIYCTLPHVIELSQQPYDKLFSILRSDPEVDGLIAPFVEAYLRNSKEMLDGQIASARIPLGRLISPDLYYVLTGNDFSLAINDPDTPRIFCLGGDPVRQEALAPVLSLYIDRLVNQINRPGRHPCALICDEFATVRAYGMVNLMATARSNNVVPVLAVQDLNQLRTQYSRNEADLFLHISGNLLCGQVNGETAKWVSEAMPRLWQGRRSVSTNSQDTSLSQHGQWEAAMTPATVVNLSSGEFIGMVADEPGQLLEMKAFHARLAVEVSGDGIYGPLPVVKEVGHADVMANFERVKREVRELVVAEMGRMMGDPALSALVLE